MKPSARVVGLAGSLVLWAWVVSAGHGAAVESEPAITPARIEADWFRQDEVRGTTSKPVAPGGATVEQDATGGVDGVIDGKWGFHTENEPNPWWQVDLGEPTALGRMLLYNRCERGMAERASRLVVLLSDDGRQFRQTYQHDGSVFYGHTDKRPLAVDLGGAKARYVRIQLPYTSYFHLDEVQILSPAGQDNVALGKPATQSSTSEWSARHEQQSQAPAARTYATALVLERGAKLAENLRLLGADVRPQADSLESVAARLSGLPADAPEPAQRALYLEARWAVRKMALANPLLDFDTILFVKRQPTLFPHVSDQYYGWFSRGGGGVYLLEGFKGDSPHLRCVTPDWPNGNFLRPDLSYDGRRVLFAYCKHYPELAAMSDKLQKDKIPEDAFYHLFEMNVDGSDVRQLTHGRYDDFDGRYLPDGGIVFLSTRKGTALQCNKASAQTTLTADQPDSYVRCGGGNHRPVAVFTLHAIRDDGSDLRPASAFENFEWTPAVANDGRVLYARWDYIDRFNGPFFSLWSTNPDGTNAQLVYGNYTARPQAVFEARPIPNSQKLIFTATAHHSITGGSLVLLDRTLGTELERPLTRLTPEVPFPETEGWASSYYANPWPLSEEHFLVGWSDRKLPPHSYFTSPDDPNNPGNAMGIYLYDAWGNLTLLHRDAEITSSNPIPVRPRPKPPTLPDTVAWDGPQLGRFLLQDVYQGLTGVERGKVARLRIVGVPPKVQPHMNNPVLGVSAEDPGKCVLGTVPVEQDGSAYFSVPSGMPVFFQALDREGLAVQTMRSLTYVQPDQTLACIGCHESRDWAPLPTGLPLAAMRAPSKLTPGPEGSWPLRYDQLVQPVLEKHCTGCHRPDGDDRKAAAFDLTAARSYDSLLSYGGDDLKKLAFEKDSSTVGQCPARMSKLLALLTTGEGHEKVRLDPDSLRRLATWMDTYAHRQGSFSPQQEEELRQLRQKMAEILAE